MSKISRLDMGAYLCIASNGVPPSVSKRIKVSVDCKCVDITKSKPKTKQKFSQNYYLISSSYDMDTSSISRNTVNIQRNT